MTAALPLAPRRGRALLFAFALAIAACTTPASTVEHEGARLPAEANRVFAGAFEQIRDRALRPVPIPEVAGDGLAAVLAVDPALALRRDGDTLALSGGGRPAWRLAAPPPDDARAWARAAVETIEVARDRSAALRERSAEQVYQAFFEGALKKFDTYTRYNTQETAREARAQREGFGGIGVTIDTSGGDVRVTSVIPETPAARGGIGVDDRIVAIEGASTAGMTARDVVRRLRGPVGDAVAVAVTRAGTTAPIAISLVREHIVPRTVAYRREGDTAIIRLSGFNQRTSDALVDALRQAEREIGPRIDGVVLDLRGNLGGLLDQSIAVADVFLADGAIVSTRGRHRGATQSSKAREGGAGEKLPLVVLVNGGSASASEIVAAALQDNDRAVVIGTVSFGKGSVQTVVTLANEGELVLTWARFHAPSGYPLADLGVRPTICTSGGTEAPAAVIARVRAGRALEPDLTQRWHAADHDDLDGLKALRGTCAPENAERDSDVAVARALLADRSLYAAALPGRGRLAVAR